MGESVEVLLGSAARRINGPSVYGRVWVWVRIHGTERKTGHHPPDRQNLPDYLTGEEIVTNLAVSNSISRSMEGRVGGNL